MPKKWTRAPSFCSKRARTVSCSGVPFGTQKSEMHFGSDLFWDALRRTRKPQSLLLPVMPGYMNNHEHIAWTLRPFLALDSRLFHGKMSPPKNRKKHK